MRPSDLPSPSPSSAQGPKPRHFSMIRQLHLADFFTLGNAACGMASVFLAMSFMRSNDSGLIIAAAVAAIAALIFDVLDGRIARWRHKHSALGRELDSLSDIISFGVGPAALAFAVGMQGGWDLAALIYFVCCGVSRLARFNVTAELLSGGGDKVKYFEGTPIPTSVLLSVVLAVCAWQGSIGESLYGGSIMLGPWGFHPLVLMFVVSGTLMISQTLRIPKF
ncbi:MAG TPA: CDP-alcohol phosphatidyltransferase family protein [Rhodocyclaceae bacterium]|nr:CDP-alcohol phosphatidyltransferase family protein [Rhodocyclaceae bacterium]